MIAITVAAFAVLARAVSTIASLKAVTAAGLAEAARRSC
jgi:hypothetical protein